MVDVKIIGDKGYIKKGSIGIGFGAWGRAASIRDQLELSDYPISLEEKEWEQLSCQLVVQVDSAIPWKKVVEAKKASREMMEKAGFEAELSKKLFEDELDSEESSSE